MVIPMAEEVPLKPITKSDIRKLELALILGTLFRPDVLEKVRNAEDKVTWLDSLIVAASALAREKAGIPISVIAEELGRSETTIRNHLSGKTEAGRLVRETYEMLVKSGGKLELQLPIAVATEDVRKRIEELEKQVNELKQKLEKARSLVQELAKELGVS